MIIHTICLSNVCLGGVSLRPGDGIIHSWLNRMLLPDTLGTGGDSHTRFPIGTMMMMIIMSMIMMMSIHDDDDDDDNYDDRDDDR